MKSFKVLMVVALMMVAGSAFAQATDDAQIQVTADVLQVCSIQAFDLNFGNYDPTATAALPGSSTVTLTCNAGSTPNLTLTGVDWMTGPNSNTLNYSLTPVRGAAAANVHPFTLDGSIPAGQYVAAGPYADTVTLNITF